MSRRGLWAIGLGLTCAAWTCGCQSTGVSADGDARAPSFGVDRVPRQTEPEVDTVGGVRQAASSQPDDDEETTRSDSSGKKGNLLTRLLPGRDKENPDRKPLPVSKRSSGTDDESSDDDDDFEF
jgi:hypothetical protein